MSPLAPPLLRAVGICRRYQRGSETVDALHGLHLDLRPGEVVALVGPSGSGKTTLLNVLCGWERPDAGHLEWCGRTDVSLATLDWSEISIVPQSSGLLEDLTLMENVELARRMGAKRDRTAEVAAAAGAGLEGGDLLGRLGLAHLAESFPRTTSLGEQQRAAVARAMLLGPSLVLADEPDRASGHAQASAVRVLDVFSDAAASGSCCLIATHNVDTISRADRVVTLVT